MIKEIMYPLALVLFVFLYCGRTTINNIIPYIHIENPVRGLVGVLIFMLIVLCTNILYANI